MNGYLCEAVNISKAFDQHPIVQNLNLSVGHQEILGLVGRSGCGKSTILNMLGLLDAPDAGEIRIHGKAIPALRSRTSRKLLRQTIGHLFQNSALVDAETADYNLRIAQAYMRSSATSKRRARSDALEAVGLTGFGQRKVYGLSGGEQQRLAIARLMLKPSELILADEPTGSLDPANRDDVLRLLLKLRETGKSIVIVTHDPAVAEICDRVIDLSEPVRSTHASPFEPPEVRLGQPR